MQLQLSVVKLRALTGLRGVFHVVRVGLWKDHVVALWIDLHHVAALLTEVRTTVYFLLGLFLEIYSNLSGNFRKFVK